MKKEERREETMRMVMEGMVTPAASKSLATASSMKADMGISVRLVASLFAAASITWGGARGSERSRGGA